MAKTRSETRALGGKSNQHGSAPAKAAAAPKGLNQTKFLQHAHRAQEELFEGIPAAPAQTSLGSPAGCCSLTATPKTKQQRGKSLTGKSFLSEPTFAREFSRDENERERLGPSQKVGAKCS